jgi:hypothetical protein
MILDDFTSGVLQTKKDQRYVISPFRQFPGTWKINIGTGAQQY